MTQPHDDHEGEHEMFGPPPQGSVYWSQPGPNPPAQPGGGSAMALPGGHTFELDEAALMQALSQMPEMQQALLEQGKALAEHANSTATIPGARYEVVVARDSSGIPQVLVQPANPEAVYDEMQHSTLMTAYTTAAARGPREQEQQQQ